MTTDRVQEMLHKYAEDFQDFSEPEKRMQFKTKVKLVESDYGVTHIRNMVEVANKRVREMLDSNHPSPVPADEVSALLLNESLHLLENVRNKLKKVKDRPNKAKK